MQTNFNEEIKEQLVEWNKVKDQIEQSDGDIDTQTLMDTLEGATNLKEVLSDMEEYVDEINGDITAINERIKKLNERKNRFNKKAETIRGMMLMAMDIAGMKEIRSPFATICVKKKPTRIEVVDDKELPARFWVSQDPVLDKKALNQEVKDWLKQLENAETDEEKQVLNSQKINGIQVIDNEISLQIRRS